MKTQTLSLILAGALVGPVWAQNTAVGPDTNRSEFATLREVVDLRLKPAQIEQLSPGARASYQKAQQLADRIDYAGAIDAVAESAAASPEMVDLQFMLIKAARWRAETTYGEESVKYYDHAETAIRRLLSNPTLGPVERARVRRESERVTTGQENLRARDDARNEAGFKLVLNIRTERLAASGLAERSDNPFGIASILEQKDATVEDDRLTAADIWPTYAAPGFEFPRPQLPQQGQFFAFGGEFGNDPFAGGGADPFGGGGADPFGGGGDPFGGGGADPFGGGGGFQGLPEGADPLAFEGK